MTTLTWCLASDLADFERGWRQGALWLADLPDVVAQHMTLRNLS